MELGLLSAVTIMIGTAMMAPQGCKANLLVTMAQIHLLGRNQSLSEDTIPGSTALVGSVIECAWVCLLNYKKYQVFDYDHQPKSNQSYSKQHQCTLYSNSNLLNDSQKSVSDHDLYILKNVELQNMETSLENTTSEAIPASSAANLPLPSESETESEDTWTATTIPSTTTSAGTTTGTTMTPSTTRTTDETTTKTTPSTTKSTTKTTQSTKTTTETTTKTTRSTTTTPADSSDSEDEEDD